MADQEGIEAIKARLNNIRSVEPILGAMRTIALGSWQAALNRRNRVLRYSQRLGRLLPILLPPLSEQGKERRKTSKTSPVRIVVLVIGSERGLCGVFNSTLLRHAEDALDQYEADGLEIELAALGTRMRRALDRSRRTVSWFESLPMTTLPTSERAYEFVHTWLARYEKRELDAVYLVHNAYRNSTRYESVTVPLIPPALPPLTGEKKPWPPPYIDTDPVALFSRVVELWATTEMYRILLSSSAAEHSARFQLMEGATQNSNRLINELTLVLQSARQQAITAEMQELAAGAGLLGGQET